jgi:hypothetical protein
MGNDEITTVYFGEGLPDKYQTTGRIDSTDWSTGQPKTDINVIVCTHIQVVTPRSTSPGPAPARRRRFPRFSRVTLSPFHG